MKKPRSFDFKKKPKNPSCLMYLAKGIISFPDLKKREFTLEKINMEELNPPYLLLVTHSSMVDFNVMVKATHPYRINNVMTLEGFNTYTEPLMRSLGVIGTRKFINDIHLVRNIKYSLEKLKNIFVLFPEARYSLDGCTSYIPKSTEKLIKVLKVPVVVLKIQGNFITCPQWNKINKKTKVQAQMVQILTAEDCKNLSLEEIRKRLDSHFVYDDFKWQQENKIRIDHPRRAEGLHRLLYKCPACKKESRMESKGTVLSCKNCNKSWEMNEYGELKALEGSTEFSHIPHWSNWQRECVRKEIEEGTYYFEDKVKVETLPGSLRFYKQGEGTLIQTREGTTLTCNYYGQPYTLFRSAKSLESMHIEYDYLKRGDCVDISIPEDSFWCYVSKKDCITKLSYATEEIYQYAFRQKQNNSVAGE